MTQALSPGYLSGFMHSTREELARTLSQVPDPAARAWAMSRYFDAQRAKKRSKFEGWHHINNPFAEMDLTELMPDVEHDILDAMHGLISTANDWWDTGIWRLPEEYFQAALSLAFVSNNVGAALQVGTNLGLCYLSGDDATNAMRVIEQAMPVAIHIGNWNTVYRMGTVKRLCLAREGKWDMAKAETHWLKQLTSATDLSSLDESALGIVNGVYAAMKDQSRIQEWSKEWDMLDKNKG